MDKIVTTRKDHICAYCERVIPKGSVMRLDKGKHPTYTEGDQIGIVYTTMYFCHKDNGCRTKEDLEFEEKVCKVKGHNFEEMREAVSCYPEDGSTGTGEFYCTNCNSKK